MHYKSGQNTAEPGVPEEYPKTHMVVDSILEVEKLLATLRDRIAKGHETLLGGKPTFVDDSEATAKQPAYPGKLNQGNDALCRMRRLSDECYEMIIPIL
jgi:hypothetical protein